METNKVLGQEYHPRVIDAELQDVLSMAGAVVIEGARGTGKTMTALNASNSFVFMDDPSISEIMAINPDSLLDGAAPRLIDEWQLEPRIWNMTRRAVDLNPQLGQFILTGSAAPADDVTRHSGAGRFIRLRQRTMTWFEKAGQTTKTVSLKELFDGHRPTTDWTKYNVEEVIDEILRPGFPALATTNARTVRRRLDSYIDEITHTDIRNIADIRHDPELIRQLIAGLARSVAGDVAYRTLASDVRPLAPTIDVSTISKYVELLQRLFVVELQKPWSVKLRSRARLRTSPKIHLADPALAAAALGTGKPQLLNDLSTLGALFESAVVHDLTVFASLLGGSVHHYRDSNNKEIDAIITLRDGRWGAIEIKLGGGQAIAGYESLHRAIEQIDTEFVGKPSFLMVITGTGTTSTAKDGTIFAPLHSLAP